MSPFSRFAHHFIAVARCGSLRRAAEQLHISASAINRQIPQADWSAFRSCSTAGGTKDDHRRWLYDKPAALAKGVSSDPAEI